MKATLSFNLPEDDHDYASATNGAKLRRAVSEMIEYLSAHEEHTSAKLMPSLPEIKAEFWRILDDHDAAKLFM